MGNDEIHNAADVVVEAEVVEAQIVLPVPNELDTPTAQPKAAPPLYPAVNAPRETMQPMNHVEHAPSAAQHPPAMGATDLVESIIEGSPVANGDGETFEPVQSNPLQI